MAQRTVALCDGKYIGIESIYTVINGRQINIPDKLKDLRNKSRANRLFCPCGCGTNLILVAGDKNLREQHFREKTGTGKYECSLPTEGRTSINSRIVLKCWLDDKLKIGDIEARVPIDTVDDTDRKPEFTFLSREKKFAVRYWYNRQNIVDDKLDVLSGNFSGIKVLYIVDDSNGGTDGQYPEALMKLQDRQQYCLLMSVKKADYSEACLKAVFYAKDIDGLWTENIFAEGRLNEFDFDDSLSVRYSGQRLEQLLAAAKDKFDKRQETERLQRIEEENQRAECIRRQQEEGERRREKLQRQLMENEEKLRIKEEKRRQEAERKQEEKRQRKDDFMKNLESYLSQQDKQVRDPDGNRWIKCEFCGKMAMENEFGFFGGMGRINLGTCKECLAKQQINYVQPERKTYNRNACPECGGMLIEKNGKYGRFLGCSNYPQCRYTVRRR